MAKITYAEAHRWLTEWPIAGLDIPAAELASRHALPTKEWWDPGLGRAIGFGGRLASGKYVLFYEHLDRRPGVPRGGTEVYADPIDVATVGVAPILDELLTSLALTRALVVWEAGADSQQKAAELVEKARRQRPELFGGTGSV